MTLHRDRRTRPSAIRQMTMSAAAMSLALCCAPHAARAAGFQNMGQSATATAMGSMGTANPDEPNASFYNSANLALREGFEIYLGDTVLLPSSSYRRLDGSQQSETVAQVFPPPNAHLGYAIDLGDAGRLGLGFGLTLPYGLGIEWEDGWDGEALIISQDLQTYNLNPNVSYKLPGVDLAFGLGAQIYRSNVRLERDVVLRDDTQVRSIIAGSGPGYGVTASTMYKPTASLSLGLNYRSAATLDIDGRARFEGEEDTPFEQTFTDQRGTTSINLPHTFTFGTGWRHERLFVGVDVNYTTWSRYQQTVLEFSEPCQQGSQTCDPSVDTTDPPTTVILNNWNDAMAFRLGVEFEAIERLKLRAGFAYDMTPVPDQTLSPSLPDNDRAVVSAGLGYSFKGARADFGYQFVNALERRVEETNNLPGVYKTSAHVLGLNLGYGF